MFKYMMMLLTSAIIWGSGFVGVKIALQAGYQPFFVSALRFFVAGFILLLTQRKHFAHTSKATYHCGVILGIFLFLGFSFQTVALKYTTVSKNAFITAIYVVIVPFLFWIIYKRRPSTPQFIAVFISLLGARFLNSNLDRGINIGDVITLGGSFFFAAHMVLLGIFVKQHSPVMLSFLQISLSGVISLIFALTFEPFPIFHLQGILAILYLGVFSSFIAFTLQNIAQKHISQITASLILSLEAVFGSLFSILILKEKLSTSFIIGGLLIMSAILLAEIKFKLPKHSKPSLPKIQMDIDS